MKNFQSIIVLTFIFPINNNSIIALWKKTININQSFWVILRTTNQLLFQYWDWKNIQSISINNFQRKFWSIITNQLLIDIDWPKLLTLQCYCTVLPESIKILMKMLQKLHLFLTTFLLINHNSYYKVSGEWPWSAKKLTGRTTYVSGLSFSHMHTNYSVF